MKFRKNLSLLCVMALSAVFCCNAARADFPIPLNNTWDEFDPANLGLGVQALSGESSSGFTAELSGPTADSTEQPKVVQNFPNARLSQVGDKITATFDVKFNNIAADSDTSFRFGLGYTGNNQGVIPVMIDLGTNAGTASRMRIDSSLTDGAVFVPGNYNSFLNAGTTLGQVSGNPGSALGGDTTTTHSFVATVERVERIVGGNPLVGLYSTVEWTTDQVGATVLFNDFNNNAVVFDDNTGLGVLEEAGFSQLPNGPMNRFDTVGFGIFSNDPFGGSTGSYTVSNFALSTNVPEPSSLLLAIGSVACAVGGGRRARMF